VFIGAPTGSAPNLYLEEKSNLLPYSKLEISVPREELVTNSKAKRRRFIAPDIPKEDFLSDYVEGRDSALEAAKKIDKETRKQVYSGNSPYSPWVRSSQTLAGSAVPPR